MAVPKISIEAIAGPENGSNLQFVVSLSESPTDAVTVQYRTIGGTAADNIDYYDEFDTLTFALGETTKIISVDPYNDSISERDEHFAVELFNASGGSLAGGEPVLRATGIIRDDDNPGATLAIFVSDPVLVEGNNGEKNAVFEVRLSQPAPSALSFNYTTADGTATAGADYVAKSGTLNFAAGQDVKSITVKVKGDGLVESPEQFSLVVTPPGSPSISTAGAAGEATILDNDLGGSKPTISILDAGGMENGSNLQIAVTLSKASTDAVTVQYRTIGGTAADNIDYCDEFDTLTFAPGETTKIISVDPYNDSISERDEHFSVELFNATGGSFAGGEPVLRATGTIRDNDNPGATLAVFVSDPVLVEGNSGEKNAVFEVRLSQPAPSGLSFNYATADGTATAGSDYVARSGTLTFAAGEVVKSVAVKVKGDTLAEIAEQFSLVVTPPGSPSISTAGAAGEATILDNDSGGPKPSISVLAASGMENGSNLQFAVTLSKASSDAVTMEYRTIGGTAADNIDYYDELDTLTFAPGETTKIISVDPYNDSIDETDEVFALELFNASGGTFAGKSARLKAEGFILDNDGVGLDRVLSVSDVVTVEKAKAESRVEVLVQLSQPSATALTFNVTAGNGKAHAGADFALLDKTVKFAPGQTVASVTVSIKGDALIEGDEAFTLEFTPKSGSAVAGTPPIATVTIKNGPSYSGATSGADTLDGTSARVLFDGLGGDDKLNGSGGNDVLIGGAGDDRLRGGTGNDDLEGGTGADRLDGGGGRDRYIFRAAPDSGVDTIVTFAAGEQVQLDHADFNKIGSIGKLKAKFFNDAATADTDDHRILYDKANGRLYYDSNGDAPNGRILIARILNGPTLDADDFLVI